MAAILPTNEIWWVVDKVRVHVICDDTNNVGRTIKRPIEEKVEDVRGEELGQSGKLMECVVKIPKSVDVEAFWKAVLSCVEKVDGRYTWADKAV